MGKWNKRVYGIIGVSSMMANWNADFTGRPKCTSDGRVFGSDKALKFSMKKYWSQQDEKVLYMKSYKLNEKGDKLQPKELTERYEEIFETTLSKKSKIADVLHNLFSAVDVLNFGATFAVEGQNIGLTGVVQIGQGMNQYEDTATEVQEILSPFRNSKKDEADASSLGMKIVSNEAHYLYPFSVNPKNYDDYIPIVDGFEGYTEEAYIKFKQAARFGATALNTNSKSGCFNHFALFVTCKENGPVYLPQLDLYVSFYKEHGQYCIDCTVLEQFLQPFLPNIESIELYYNPHITKVKETMNIFNKKHIFTEEAIDSFRRGEEIESNRI